MSAKAWTIRPSDTLSVTDTVGLHTKVVVLGHEDDDVEEVVATVVNITDTSAMVDDRTQVLKHELINHTNFLQVEDDWSPAS